MERKTSYAKAVKYCNNSFVLCNNIAEIDPTVYENMQFESYNEETRQYTEIFQWYITDASEGDIEFLEESFGLLFTYSNALDCYVLCVDHWGTSWDYVPCSVLNDDIPDGLIKVDHDI